VIDLMEALRASLSKKGAARAPAGAKAAAEVEQAKPARKPAKRAQAVEAAEEAPPARKGARKKA
jgi:DNA end-binding protein Ku